MAMCAFSTSYSNSSALSRIDPSYNTPNALGTISVYVKKIGNVSYYVAKRYLGLVSDNVLQYTSPTAISLATNPTFTTTGLSANTKYTFVCVATDVQEFWYSAEHLHAIPLDEEQLLKLNFEKEVLESGSVKYKKGAFRLMTKTPKDFTNIEIWYREDRRQNPDVHSIHQLQNQYLDMTKVHLTREKI